jgi:hypothetical protein
MKTLKTKMSNYRKCFIIAHVLLVAIIFCGCNYNVVDTDKVTKAFEQAYFEGQKDALNGDLRIKKNNDGCWIWTKSCWNSGRQPTFNPSIVCDGSEK